jgi:hypothetical protein
MRVIRNGTGWDIAFDLLFAEKATAEIIARRIAPLVATLVRDAVDASMGRRLAPKDTRTIVSASGLAIEAHAAQPARQEEKQAEPGVPLTVYSMHSITPRARQLGLLLPSSIE